MWLKREREREGGNVEVENVKNKYVADSSGKCLQLAETPGGNFVATNLISSLQTFLPLLGAAEVRFVAAMFPFAATNPRLQFQL